MSRLGRSQPVQPAAWHGFVDPGPAAVGTVPPRAVVVPHDPRPRQFYLPPQVPITIHGTDTVTSVPSPINIDRVDQRVRFQPLVPIALSAALASVTAAPAVLPSGPFVVPLDERRRFLAALAPTITHGPPPVGPVTYNDSGTVTLNLSVSGTESHTHSNSATATVTLTPSGTESHSHVASGTATVTLSQTGTQSHSHTASGTVALTLTPSGIEDFHPPAGPSGGNYRSQADEVRLLLFF